MKLLFMFLILCSCSSQSLKKYENEKPELDLRKFFNGKIEALGIVQNRSGEVIQRFKVDIDASWQNNTATLDEDFVYSDGSKSKRVWTLNDLGNNEYVGTAGDIIGKAKGKVAGNAFYFKYVLDVPVGDKTYHITLDDWMYLLDKKTLLARSYMTKFGFDVGEVTLVMINKDMK